MEFEGKASFGKEMNSLFLREIGVDSASSPRNRFPLTHHRYSCVPTLCRPGAWCWGCDMCKEAPDFWEIRGQARYRTLKRWHLISTYQYKRRLLKCWSISVLTGEWYKFYFSVIRNIQGLNRTAPTYLSRTASVSGDGEHIATQWTSEVSLLSEVLLTTWEALVSTYISTWMCR